MSEYEKINFEKSIASQSAKWVGADFISKYYCFLLPFHFIIIFFIADIINISDIKQNGIPTPFFIILPIMLVLSILSLRAIIKNNKLIKVNLEQPATELRATLKKELEQAGWRVNRSNAKFLTAHKERRWTIGSKIAILFKNDEAHINVQNMYGSGYFPFSFGRNKRITNAISKLIKSGETSGLLNQLL